MIFQIFRYFAIQPNLNTRYHFSIASYICYPIIVFYIYINLIFYFLIRWKSHLFKFLAQCRSLLIKIKTFRAGFIKFIAREIASTFSSLCKPTNMIFFLFVKKGFTVRYNFQTLKSSLYPSFSWILPVLNVQYARSSSIEKIKRPFC